MLGRGLVRVGVVALPVIAVIATMTLALAAGSNFLEAARLANYAGGIVVMKRGTATVSAAELRSAVLGDRG